MANLKLHQAVALLKDAKAYGEGVLTKAHHVAQKGQLFAGLDKTYEPTDAEGQRLPREGNVLQQRIEKLLDDAMVPVIRQLDLDATVEAGNQVAKADVVVDGVVILSQVPSTTLLHLERKLIGPNGLLTFIEALPVLDPSVKWHWDDDIEAYRSEPSEKTRSDKVPYVLETSPATAQHKAQVEVLHRDQVVGTWTTVQFSGALSSARRRELADKVRKLAAAVKVAREEANRVEVPDTQIGQAVFDFLAW